ncbi:hypothetical protein M408DRAFT_182044 [Serendipita vermifera MAFF 305830]|uniref:Uncharacterized protein n=1 Tax=Serendipita vermifera MAFF 305830 TaxID=933852 RepID=A0A0C2WJX1_SERVB|nr:hypothetical protein M408DRAFT_182044 [Serendipita vermifera MAFF 305830]
MSTFSGNGCCDAGLRCAMVNDTPTCCVIGQRCGGEDGGCWVGGVVCNGYPHCCGEGQTCGLDTLGNASCDGSGPPAGTTSISDSPSISLETGVSITTPISEGTDPTSSSIGEPTTPVIVSQTTTPFSVSSVPATTSPNPGTVSGSGSYVLLVNIPSMVGVAALVVVLLG